jgi:glycine/D-amino acid oxidase-like deaminating enzyme
MTGGWTIVGQGLAGTCLAWHFWNRGLDFSIIDRENGGSTRVAAGLINPITGKNFEPSWRIGEFLPEALGFYTGLEQTLGVKLWYPLPVLRLVGSEKEWTKISSKLGDESVKSWVASVVSPPEGWVAAVEVAGGGRLDTRTFADASRAFFQNKGIYRRENDGEGKRIWCDGAVGLMAEKYGPHRCAKGEILTIRAEGWDETHVRVGGGGWLLPIGDGLFRAGATYEWNELDERPTVKGREFVERIIRKLGGDDFEMVAHEAGIRPILRKSQPLIGFLENGDWMFNGLGSKGSLYAPGVARRLVEGITGDSEIEPELDWNHFLNP